MEKKTITFILDDVQFTKFKIYCVENKTTMTDFLKDKINNVIKLE